MDFLEGKHILEYMTFVTERNLRQVKDLTLRYKNKMKIFKWNVLPEAIFTPVKDQGGYKTPLETLSSLMSFGSKHAENLKNYGETTIEFTKRYHGNRKADYIMGARMNARLTDVVLDIGKPPLYINIQVLPVGIGRDGLIGAFIREQERMSKLMSSPIFSIKGAMRKP